MDLALQPGRWCCLHMEKQRPVAVHKVSIMQRHTERTMKSTHWNTGKAHITMAGHHGNFQERWATETGAYVAFRKGCEVLITADLVSVLTRGSGNGRKRWGGMRVGWSMTMI